MLEEIKKLCIKSASCLGDYQKLSKQELADGYCDAVEDNDEDLRDHYYSALVLRYWFKIGKYYAQSRASGFSIEDCYDWLNHSLMYALEHHPWRNPDNKLYKDKNGADKTINRCIISTRLINYQHANTDKGKMKAISSSLDSLMDDNGDCVIKTNAMECSDSSSLTDDIIKDFVSNDKIKEALIIDGICNQDSFREMTEKKTISAYSYIDYDEDGNEVTVEVPEESYKSNSAQFSTKKLVSHLTNMNDNFITYFCDNYCIEKSRLEEEYCDLKKMGSTKINKLITKTLSSLKNSDYLKGILC